MQSATRAKDWAIESSQARGDRALAWRMLGLNVAYWIAFYFLMLSRIAVADEPPTLGYFGNALRFIPLSIFGIALSAGLYIFFRSRKSRPVSEGFAVAFALTVPAALLFGAVSNYLFYYSSPTAIQALGPYQPYSVRMMLQQGLPWSFTIFGWNALVLAMRYSEEVAERERRLAQVHAQAQEAQVRALRYQINPHFLFNTLNSISSMIWEGDPARAEAMLVDLSDFMRTTLEIDPSEDVTLDQEISLQHLYLKIEQTRFEDRLIVAVEVPDELGQARVPSLILQPIVENAVRYAVAPRMAPTTLSIAARRDRGKLIIDVEDDGEPGRHASAGTGVGLANVRERLVTRFGDGVKFHAGPISRGFRVTLEMPLELA